MNFRSFRPLLISTALSCLVPAPAAHAAETAAPASEIKPAAASDKAEAELTKTAASWVEGLALNDASKAERVQALIVQHLRAVRDWHNQHPYTGVPAGINPATGQPLSVQDRQIIADSAMPRTVHDTLMTGLRAQLTPEQVEAVLDKYTIGKVAFTLQGYKAIVPDLTPQEEAHILGLLRQAREQAIDYKGMKLVSAIFEIYKTQCEQYLNSNGRNWKQLYRAYTDAAKARKAAAKAAGTPSPVPGPAAVPAPGEGVVPAPKPAN